MQVIHPVAFQNHPRARHIGKRPVDLLRGFLRRHHQTCQHFIRLGEGIASVVLLGDHHAETGRVGENRQEGHMLFVFPQNMGRGGFSDNAAENTIHLNHRQFHHGLGCGNHLKARVVPASKNRRNENFPTSF